MKRRAPIAPARAAHRPSQMAAHAILETIFDDPALRRANCIAGSGFF